MIDWFEQYSESEAFKVYLVKDERGYDQLRWTRLQQGVPYTWYTEPRSSFWLRFGVGLMRVLPIESQL